jgi:hypothetical protein
VSEILKEKNVGENAGGVQVDEKELTVAKVANGETEQFDQHNNQNAQWVDTKNAANHERREQRSTGSTGLLAFEGKQQNQTGVNKKDQDAEMADGHQIEVAAQGRGVLEVEQKVKKNNEENGAGSEKVQICAFRSGVQVEPLLAPSALTGATLDREQF